MTGSSFIFSGISGKIEICLTIPSFLDIMGSVTNAGTVRQERCRDIPAWVTAGQGQHPVLCVFAKERLQKYFDFFVLQTERFLLHRIKFSCRFLICVSNGFRICNRNLKFGYLSFFRFLRFRYQENAKVRQFCIEKHSRMVYNRCCSKCVYRCLKRMHIHHIHFEFGQRADTGFLTERPVSLTECFATF